MAGIVLPNLGLHGDIPNHALWGDEGRANDRRLDSLVMPGVKDILNDPDPSPLDGDRYLVGTAPTGAWGSKAGNIAQWNAALAMWVFYSPKNGWATYINADRSFYRHVDSWFNDDLVCNVKRWGAAGDGVTDDEPALNALFDHLATASVGRVPHVHFPYGVYLIKATVFADGKHAISPISGLKITADPGTVIRAATPGQGGVWDGNGAFFKFRQSASPATNVLIECFVFDGQGFGIVDQSVMGIYATAITGLRIRDCTFQDLGLPASSTSPRNDGILLGDDLNDITSCRSKDVTIEDCRFLRCVRNGISMLDVDDVTVEKCHFDHTENAGIDIEPNHTFQFARNITVERCEFRDFGALGIVAIPGSSIRTVTYPDQMETIKIHKCVMDGAVSGDIGILTYHWRDADVSNNTILRPGDIGIYQSGCFDSKIIGNTVRGGAGTAAKIFIDKPDTPQPASAIVKGNQVIDAQGYGFRIHDLDGGVFDGNIVRNYDLASANRSGVEFLTATGICRNIAIGINVITGGVLGKPMVIGSGCTHVAVGFNVAQENGAGNFDDSIDNNAPSTVHAFNCDDQRATRPFTSASGYTPISGAALGQTDNQRRSAYEVEVLSSETTPANKLIPSSFIDQAKVTNVIFSPINAAAAQMMDVANDASLPIYCARVATGFELRHRGNPSGVSAFFMCLGVNT